MKHLRLLLCLLVFPASHLARAEGGDDPRVKQQVHDFFQWYCHALAAGHNANVAKHHRKEMSRYVAANFLAKLARKSEESQEGDEFLGGLDLDPEWEKNIAVSNVKAGKKGVVTAEVLLTGKSAGNVHALVTLEPEGGTYKIADVEPIPDFAATETAQLKAFYEQYLYYLMYYHDGDQTPVSHEKMQEGLTADGRKKAAAAASGKVDYFVQAEGWEKSYKQNVEIKKAEVSPDATHGTAEILITGGTMTPAHVKVSLKHEDDMFKIDEVEKIND